MVSLAHYLSLSLPSYVSFSFCLQCLDPERVDSLLKKDCELIGRLYYKEGHDLYHWRKGWFSLVGSELFLYPDDECVNEVVLQLKRLQELSKNTQAHENPSLN